MDHAVNKTELPNAYPCQSTNDTFLLTKQSTDEKQWIKNTNISSNWPPAIVHNEIIEDEKCLASNFDSKLNLTENSNCSKINEQNLTTDNLELPVNHVRNFSKTKSLDILNDSDDDDRSHHKTQLIEKICDSKTLNCDVIKSINNETIVEMSSSSNNTNNVNTINEQQQVRPIYPNVPYSPYGSPYGSPRTDRRRAPLRESRRISIEQSGSFLQLNQYKLLDEIGQDLKNYICTQREIEFNGERFMTAYAVQDDKTLTRTQRIKIINIAANHLLISREKPNKVDKIMWAKSIIRIFPALRDISTELGYETVYNPPTRGGFLGNRLKTLSRINRKRIKLFENPVMQEPLETLTDDDEQNLTEIDILQYVDNLKTINESDTEFVTLWKKTFKHRRKTIKEQKDIIEIYPKLLISAAIINLEFALMFGEKNELLVNFWEAKQLLIIQKSISLHKYKADSLNYSETVLAVFCLLTLLPPVSRGRSSKAKIPVSEVFKKIIVFHDGSYGLVKLAYSEEDSTHYAMKILSKRRLMRKVGFIGRGPKRGTSPLERVYREIAVLKKLDHPNVVKLVEVLDDPMEDSLYMVFELVHLGEVLSVPTDSPLSEERTWSVFRDVVLGLEYLHYQRIIHGDIKPGNLLLAENGRVKIADLGVCNEFKGEDSFMNTSSSVGTPAFRAPETLRIGIHSYSGKATDIWALGATLYALVFGTVPYNADSILEVYEQIRNDVIKFSDKIEICDDLKDLILKMLNKNPTERITLPQIKDHKWVTNNGKNILPSEEINCRLVQVNDEDINSVVKSIPKLDTLILIKTMLKKHSFQNPFSKGISGRAPQRGGSKLERFSRSGRSNSAPEYQVTDRQLQNENILPSLQEGVSSSTANDEGNPNEIVTEETKTEWQTMFPNLLCKGPKLRFLVAGRKLKSALSFIRRCKTKSDQQ